MSSPPVRKPRPRRRTRGTLAVLAGLMLASGVIRLGTGVGEALTAAPTPPQAAEQAAEAPPDPGPLLEALRARDARLAERETALEMRMQALAVAQEELDRSLRALTDAEERLTATLAIADQAAERDLARLTAVYESMKPAEAARLFEEMDPRFAAGFLGRMRPEAAAAVLSGLDPAAAYTISVLLAGRHARVPTD